MHLSVENVTKVFGLNGQRHTVLREVSFSVHEGEFVSLLGPSGCGKTTLLTIIAGFQKQSAGRVVLNGRVVDRPGPDRGFVFQDYALFPWMTVRDNVLFPMRQQKLPRREQEERLARLLAMAQLSGKAKLFPSQISGGLKQRTAFIRALAGSPQVLLMDEPLGAVDQEMRRVLQEELESLWLADRTTVIMVTHDVDEAVYLSDRVIVLSADEGRICAEVGVGLPRPRTRDSDDYRLAAQRLGQALASARTRS